MLIPSSQVCCREHVSYNCKASSNTYLMDLQAGHFCCHRFLNVLPGMSQLKIPASHSTSKGKSTMVSLVGLLPQQIPQHRITTESRTPVSLMCLKSPFVPYEIHLIFVQSFGNHLVGLQWSTGLRCRAPQCWA